MHACMHTCPHTHAHVNLPIYLPTFTHTHALTFAHIQVVDIRAFFYFPDHFTRKKQETNFFFQTILLINKYMYDVYAI
jgi:hypothetical protein